MRLVLGARKLFNIKIEWKSYRLMYLPTSILLIIYIPFTTFEQSRAVRVTLFYCPPEHLTNKISELNMKLIYTIYCAAWHFISVFIVFWQLSTLYFVTSFFTPFHLCPFNFSWSIFQHFTGMLLSLQWNKALYWDYLHVYCWWFFFKKVEGKIKGAKKQDPRGSPMYKTWSGTAE